MIYEKSEVINVRRSINLDMNTILRKVAILFERKENALFSYDIEKQKAYMKKKRMPRDEIERSYFQYKCQMKLKGTISAFCLNVFSFPLMLVYLLKGEKNVDCSKKCNVDAIFYRDGKPENILPNSLRKRYSIIEMNPVESFCLDRQDRAYIKKLVKRYPLSFHFILKCIIKIGKYSYAINKYVPDAIIVCAEYSFTSSVLTDYCRKKNIKHIDVMHGEKLFYMRDSFFEFDECYVWDVYYKNLLLSMYAAKEQFIVETPDSLKLDKNIKNKKIYDYTYYLGAEDEKTLKKIANELKVIQDKGKYISVRPHPRYSNKRIIREMFSFANIEDEKNITIEESLLQTRNAISLYSTVLNQAICNSISIIIDDISNPKYYKKLKELKYICLAREHELLSQILKDEFESKQ